MLSQVLDIAWLCLRGLHPGLRRARGVFLSWLLVLACPVLARRRAAPLIGALLLPMAMIMEIVVVPGASDPGTLPEPAAWSVHIFCRNDWDGPVWSGGGDQRGSPAERAAPRRGCWMPPSRACRCRRWMTGTIRASRLVWPSVVYADDGDGDVLAEHGWASARSRPWARRFFTLIRQPRYALSFLTWLIFERRASGWSAVLGLRGRRAAMWTLVRVCDNGEHPQGCICCAI